MSVSLREIQKLIERLAPPAYACDWDNSGFNVNLHNEEVTGIMVCLDVSDAVIDRAAQLGCNLILSHHPLLFHPVKTVDSDTYEGRCIRRLVKKGISLYCAHTSMDAAPGGINSWLAEALRLHHCQYLGDVREERFFEVAVHVPPENSQQIRDAMARAGAGRLGDYTDCTYNIAGKGMFRPDEKAHPYIGSAGNLETVDEIRVTSVCSEKDLKAVLSAIRRAHPYEEPAISALCLKEPIRECAGIGMVGDLQSPQQASSLVDQIKEKLDVDTVRVCGDLRAEIKRVAVCGGAGGDFIEKARELGAQLYLTGEIKHNYYAAEQQMLLVEAGHFDTEKCFCKLYAEGLQKLMNDVNYNIAVYIEDLHRPYVNY